MALKSFPLLCFRKSVVRGRRPLIVTSAFTFTFPRISIMLDQIRNVERTPSFDKHVPDNKPILEPQLNVGGHGLTQRHLRNYHVTMIGLCSGIGTGLFIGTGSAYSKAGPAGLLLAYIIVGSVLWCVMQSIAELATLVSPLTFIYIHRVDSVSHRSPPLVRSLTLQAASSTRPWDSLWL
jgi:hypothetical protein